MAAEVRFRGHNSAPGAGVHLGSSLHRQGAAGDSFAAA